MRTSSRSGTLVAENRPLAAGRTIGIMPSGLFGFGVLGLTDATSKLGAAAGWVCWAAAPLSAEPIATNARATIFMSTPDFNFQFPNSTSNFLGFKA
jgi:hypothetical protein